jgi:hypothetical protein
MFLTSFDINCSVAVPPKITPFSFRSDLHLDERVGVQCVVSKGDAPLNIHWLKDGQELTQGDGLVLRTLDEFTSVLSIGALAPEHGGNYTCVARNAAARAAYSAPLSVNGTVERVHVALAWSLEENNGRHRVRSSLITLLWFSCLPSKYENIAIEFPN